MDPLFIASLLVFGILFSTNSHQQRQRVALLASHLGPLHIEKLMETLTQGYLRALGEPDAARQAQVFAVLAPSEEQLSNQLAQLAQGFAAVPPEQARASNLPVSLPYAAALLPAATFDMRKLLAVHANGVARALQANGGVAPRDRAFRVSAELFLLQHSCHWFCKSSTVASARMQARHQTSYAQVLAAVSPETRRAYSAVTSGHAG